MFKLQDENNVARWRQTLFAILSLAVLIVTIYSNTLHVPFQFDDYRNIEMNCNIFMRDLSWASISNTFYGYNTAGTELSRPFAYLSLGLNYYFGGLNTFGYHLVNIVIHFLTAFFLYLLVRKTLQLPVLRSRYGSSAYSVALLASILWASHPIQTQAITYIVQRMASMAALFYVSSLFFYIKGRTSVSKVRWFYFAFSILAALVAFGTKENTAVLPFTILLYEYLFLQSTSISWKKILLATVFTVTAFALLAILFRGLSVFSDTWQEILAGYPNRDFTPYERVLTQFRVVIYYLTLLLYPAQHRLSLDHDFSVSHSFLDPPTTLLAALLIMLLITLAAVFARRRPLISFCIFWYFLNLLVESSIFNLELVFEHRLYLPSMSFFLLVSVGIVSILKKIPVARKKVIATCLTGAFLILQGNGTYVRNFVWQTKFSLWNDCLEKAPTKARTLQNIGLAAYGVGQYDKAETFLLQSLRSEPDNENTFNSLGTVYLAKKEYEKALDAFKQAEKNSPQWATPIANQGAVYHQMGQLEKAEIEYKRSLSIQLTANASYGLGMLYLAQDNFKEALSWLKKTIDGQPSYQKALYPIGLAYQGLNRYQEALQCFDRALATHPKQAEALLGKAETYAELGNKEAMTTALNELLRWHPFHYKGNLLLGKEYLSQKNYQRAKTCFRMAASIDPTTAEPYRYLSRLYRETGDQVLANYYEARFKESNI